MALIDKVRVIKLLLFALFMMVSMVTPAQSQVDWSIKAGIGMANIIGDNMGSPKVKLAYKLGIGLECPFDKIWSLQTGVSFVSKGTNHTIVETDGISAQAKVNASYLELPVMVAARFAMDRNTYILVAAGPYGAWENIFKVKPEVFTREEKRAWLDKNTDVALGSDAFFPFGDNVERAHKSGVKYIAQPGGSIRDDHVIATCNKYGIAMAFTGIRLFHH